MSGNLIPVKPEQIKLQLNDNNLFIPAQLHTVQPASVFSENHTFTSPKTGATNLSSKFKDMKIPKINEKKSPDKKENIIASIKLFANSFMENLTPLLYNFAPCLPIPFAGGIINTFALLNASTERENVNVDHNKKPTISKEELITRKFLLVGKLLKDDVLRYCKDDIDSIMKNISDKNIELMEKAVNFLNENKEIFFMHKLNILLAASKESKKGYRIDLIEKVIMADKNKLPNSKKALFIEKLWLNEEFAKILLDTDSIENDGKANILSMVNLSNFQIFKSIIENEKFNPNMRYNIISGITKHNLNYAAEIINCDNINPFDMEDVIAIINEDNIIYAREIINNPNIHSCNKADMILEIDKDNIELAREHIFNNDFIKSCDKRKVLNSINEDNKQFAIDEILYSDKIKSCDKAAFLKNLNGSNIQYAKIILDNPDIPSADKEFILDYINEDNAKWISKISKFKNKTLVNLFVTLEEAAKNRKTYQRKTLEFLQNNKLPKKELLNLLAADYLYADNIISLLKKYPQLSLEDADLVSHTNNHYIINDMLSEDEFLTKFSPNTPHQKILKETEEGDVIQIEEKLYINDGNKLLELDIPKQTFKELFPPVKRFLTTQNNLGDCYLIAVIMALMNNPKGRKYLFKSFSQKGKDIFCTIRAYKDFNGTVKFKDGKLPDTDAGVEACKGIKMLERAYEKVALRENTFSDISSEEFPQSLERINSGFASDAFMDLTGASKTEISDNLKHEVIDITTKGKDITRDFLKEFINNKNNCAIISFKKSDSSYKIINQHGFIIDKYDEINDTVNIINPHEPNIILKIPYKVFSKLFRHITICNLEEN